MGKVFFPGYFLIENGDSSHLSSACVYSIRTEEGEVIVEKGSERIVSVVCPVDSHNDYKFVKLLKEAFIGVLEEIEYEAIFEIYIDSFDRYSAALVSAICIRSRLGRAINFVYESATYEFQGRDLQEALSNEEIRNYVNDRDTEIVGIPYSEGKFRPSSYKYFAHLHGFDYFRTINLVSEYEPTSVRSIGSPEPSTRDLSNVTGIEDGSFVGRLSVVDLVVALRDWSAKVPNSIHNKPVQPIVFASGWKTHVVASVIWSVLESEIPIFVPLPDNVIPIKRVNSGQQFRFSLIRAS